MSPALRTSKSVSRPRSTRRSRNDVARIREQLFTILRDDNPMTVRQVFYRMVTQPEPLIGKTESEYKQTIVRLLSQMRRSGDLPFHWIADNTRWMRKPTTFGSLDAALAN